MNWPKYADHADYADYADYADHADHADYADYADYVFGVVVVNFNQSWGKTNRNIIKSSVY